MSRSRIAGLTLAVIVGLILAWAAVDRIASWRRSEARSEAALLTESFDRADQVEALREKLRNIPVRTEIRVVTRTVSGPTRIENVPADCRACLEGVIIPISASSRYWRASSPDITRQDLRVDILPAYADEVIRPCRDALAETTRQLARSEPYHPLRLNLEASAGYGLSGIPAEARVAIETGRRTEFSLGLGASANLAPDGELTVNPAITLRIERRVLP